MDDDNFEIPRLPYIRKICAHLPEKEIREAEERFVEYIELMMEIESRLPSDEGNNYEI